MGGPTTTIYVPDPYEERDKRAADAERARIVAAIRNLRRQRLLGQKPDKPWNGGDWADWIENGCPDGE